MKYKSSLRRPWWVRLMMVAGFFAGFLILLVLFAIAGIFAPAFYRHYVTFPAERAAWEAIRAERREVALDDGYNNYRGVLHSHSHLSHDSNVPFEEILAALKETDRDFIGMTDHCHEGKGDYSLHWDGLCDGKLFMAGYELSNGFMPWGLPSDAVIDCNMEEAELAAWIEAQGGVLFFGHTERERAWQLPQLAGMEIYNIHTDFLDETNPLTFAPDIVVSHGKYPMLTFRRIFDEQTAIIARWDALNETRDITGIAGNDCHQNQGYRFTYLEGGVIQVENTEPDVVANIELNPFTWVLARVLFGPLEPGRELWFKQLDPYALMVDFVSTHVLAEELTKESILAALVDGRAFVAFDAIADARGFTAVAENEHGRAAIGEELPFVAGSTTLKAESPHRGKFVVIYGGEVVHEYEGSLLSHTPEVPGKYRIEMHLDIRGEWTPWIYTNPIHLLPSQTQLADTRL